MLKDKLKLIIGNSKLPKLAYQFRKSRIIVLMYHGFFKESEKNGLEKYGSRWTEIHKFKQQIEYLLENFNIISFDTLEKFWQGSAKLPSNPVIITMDDGYESNYSLAYPLLHKLKIPFSIFVSTDFINKNKPLWPDQVETAIWRSTENSLHLIFSENDSKIFPLTMEPEKLQASLEIKKRLNNFSQEAREKVLNQIGYKLSYDKQAITSLHKPLEWQQIKEMINSGLVSIGSHSVSHPNLTLCTDESLDNELIASKNVLEDKLNTKCSVFCYPGGNYDKRVQSHVKKAKYTFSLTIGGRSNLQKRAQCSVLNRIGVSQNMSIQEFALRLGYL